MADFAHAIIYVLFAWWFSTGAILYLDGLNPRTFRWTVLAATAIMVTSVAAIVVTRSDTTPFGAYAAFTASLLVWGWNEVLFLTGFVTGPWRRPCPPDATGWRRFRLASLTLVHHEALIIASLGGIWAISIGAANQLALQTFLVLWAMRLSTKFNIFLGVSNLGEEFLPPHLSYLATFFRRRAMNPLFPASVAAASIALIVIIGLAGADEASAFDRIGLSLLATLIGLGLVEHLFLVMPIRIAALWNWGFASRREGSVHGTAQVLTPPAANTSQPIKTAAAP